MKGRRCWTGGIGFVNELTRRALVAPPLTAHGLGTGVFARGRAGFILAVAAFLRLDSAKRTNPSFVAVSMGSLSFPKAYFDKARLAVGPRTRPRVIDWYNMPARTKMSWNLPEEKGARVLTDGGSCDQRPIIFLDMKGSR